MEANVLLGMSSLVLGLGAGTVLLVLHRKNGNGHKPGTEPARPLKDVPDWQLERDTALKDLVDRLDYLPVRMEQAFRHSLEEQSKEPEIPPDWAARMLGELEHIHPEQAQLAKVAINLERLTEQLEAFMQLPPPAPPEIPRVDDLVRQIEALVDVGRRSVAKAETTTRDVPARVGEVPPTQPSPTMAPPDPRESGPIQRAAAPVILDEFNTVFVTANTIYQLIPPEAHLFRANVLNLGPGWLYMRSNAEPSVGDVYSTILPPSAADNEVRVPGHLYVLATDTGTITVRLAM